MRADRHSIVLRTLSCALALVMPMVSGLAAALPADFTAGYEVNREILDRLLKLGDAQLSLTHTDSSYRYDSRTRPIRVIALFYGDEVIETSDGRLFGDLIRPDRYDFVLKGRGAHSDYILFQWGRGEVEQHFKDETVRQRVPQEMFDRLSLQLAIMSDLARGARVMQYLVADRNRIYAYHFEVTGSEHINTPLGDFETVKVELTGQQRIANPESLRDDAIANMNIPRNGSDDRRTVFWCAPALDFIPVQVEYTDRDQSAYRMDLKSLERPK